MLMRRFFSKSAVSTLQPSRISFNKSEVPEKNLEGDENNYIADYPAAISSAYAKSEPGYQDRRAYIRLPGMFYSSLMPSNFRLGYFPIYEAPSNSYISLIKRVSLGIAVLGSYSSYMVYAGSYLSLEISAIIASLSVLPFPIVDYFTKGHVTKIFRLYDNTKSPQTYENLTENETLVFEQMYKGGKRCYNELVKVDKLKLTKTLYGSICWEYVDDMGNKRYYKISDDIGGIKMDRIWGIVEKNSNINNGRLLMEN